MRYRPDEANLREQRENLDNVQYELTIKAKQEEIDLVEQEIDKLNDEKEKYQDQIDSIQKKIDLLNEQKDANQEIIDGINEQNDALDEQIEKIEEQYSKMKTNIDEYKKNWEEIAELSERAANAALISSIGFDPEAIKNLDPESLEAFSKIYNSVLGNLYAEDEDMMNALQNLAGGGLGDYLSSTADGIAALDKLDLSSVSTAIQTAGQGILAMNDGFALANSIIPNVVKNLEGVVLTADGARAAIGTAISTEKTSGTGADGQPTLASSISELGNISEQALGEEDGVQKDLAGVQEAAEIATDDIGGIKSALDDLTSGSPYTVEIQVKRTGDEISTHAKGTVGNAFNKGTVGNAYADGYPGLNQSELALRSEYGQPELTVYPNGSYELTNTPTLSHLPKDTVIFNEEQTKRILRNSGKSGKAFAEGNATSGQLRSLKDVMPDKAAIFERFEANLQANLDALKVNTFDVSRNIADIAKAVTTNNFSNNVVVNGGINVTCPGVTEAEVARNIAPIIQDQFTSIFTGMSLGANQRAMRR